MNLDEIRKNAVKNAINEHYAVISFKVDGTIKDANEKFLNLFGYKLDEIVDKHHKIFVKKSTLNQMNLKNFGMTCQMEKFKLKSLKELKKMVNQFLFKLLINR